MPSPQEAQTCQVCQKTCKALRCSGCHQTRYCSISCQRKHWKAGHRQACSAMAAMKELQVLAVSLSTDDAIQNAEKATSAVKYLQETSTSPDVLAAGSKVGTRSSAHPSDGMKPKLKNNTEKGPSIASSARYDELTPRDCEPEEISCSDTEQRDTILRDRSGTFLVEEMRRVSKYHITLKPAQSTALPTASSADLNISIQNNDPKLPPGAKVSIKESASGIDLLQIDFPRRLKEWTQQDQVFVEPDGTLQIRLSYADESDRFEPPESLRITEWSFDGSMGLCCNACHKVLIPRKNIERVLPLPAGHWEEIADYLICYNGQPATEFSASSSQAREGILLQDPTALCVHQMDTGTSLIVSAKAGYGESSIGNDEADSDKFRIRDDKDLSVTIRGGARSWRDTVGGATLCCSSCKAQIGFASIDSPHTYRLLKHRLATKNEATIRSQPKRKEYAPVLVCTSFLVREMIRYAESKAIFTFVVAQDDPLEATMTAFTFHKKCILLRLLSWDSRVAVGFEPNSNKASFGQAAKIVYEETVDRLADVYKAGGSQWLWGDVDLCCPSPQDNKNGTRHEKQDSSFIMNDEDGDDVSSTSISSVVRMYLPPAEWNEIKDTIFEGSWCLSKSTVEATLLMKFGTKNITKDMGLSVIRM